MDAETSPVRNKYHNMLSILAAFFLLPPLLILGLWIRTFSANPSASQAEKVEIYMRNFPDFLQSGGAISIAVLVSSVAGILLGAFAFGKASTPYRILSVLTIVIGSLLALLELFSLM